MHVEFAAREANFLRLLIFYSQEFLNNPHCASGFIGTRDEHLRPFPKLVILALLQEYCKISWLEN